jgi:hypothetical protein
MGWKYTFAVGLVASFKKNMNWFRVNPFVRDLSKSIIVRTRTSRSDHSNTQSPIRSRFLERTALTDLFGTEPSGIFQFLIIRIVESRVQFFFGVGPFVDPLIRGFVLSSIRSVAAPRNPLFVLGSWDGPHQSRSLCHYPAGIFRFLILLIVESRIYPFFGVGPFVDSSIRSIAAARNPRFVLGFWNLASWNGPHWLIFLHCTHKKR